METTVQSYGNHSSVLRFHVLFSLQLVLVFDIDYVIAELAVHAMLHVADAPVAVAPMAVAPVAVASAAPPETGSDGLTLDRHLKDYFVGWYRRLQWQNTWVEETSTLCL